MKTTMSKETVNIEKRESEREIEREGRDGVIERERESVVACVLATP